MQARVTLWRGYRFRRPAKIVDGQRCVVKLCCERAAYVNGAYLLDPMFARAAAARTPELVRLSEIVPGDFSDSEYMQSYYKDSNIVDEVNYLVPGRHRHVFAVCLERSRSRERFEDPEIARFKAWLPNGRCDQKREDAFLMLRAMREFSKQDEPPLQVAYHFEHTTLWEQAARMAAQRAGQDAAG